MSDMGMAGLLGQHLLITTALAAIVLLICRTVTPSSAARHVLWLLVLCRLMVPPVVMWPWSISIPAMNEAINVGVPGTSQSSAKTAKRDPRSSSGVVSMTDAVPVRSGVSDDGVSESEHVTFASSRGTRLDAPAIGAKTSLLSIPRFIAFLWTAGSVAVFIVLLHRIRRVGHLLQSEANAGAWLRIDVAQLCHRLGVKPPDCVVTGAAGSPFLWCLGRVRLVWPLTESYVEQREQVRPILVHELAHLKRRDHWTAWLETVALTVWWWNPVFWIVRRELRAAAEMACDAWVLKLLPSQRREYAESLVEFSSRDRSNQLAFGAVGAGTGSRRMFARRLEMIMNGDAAPCFSKRTAAAAALLGVLSLPAFAIRPESQATGTQDPVAESSASDKRAMEEDERAESGPGRKSQDESQTSRTRVVEVTRSRVLESEGDGPGDANSGSGAASLREVLSHIEKEYYGSVDRRELERAAIEAIMSKLDDRSRLLTRDEYEQLQVSIDGNLVGVGIAIHLNSDTEQPVVTRPIRNSPAQAAGIRRNDVIVSIDEESTEGLSLKQLVSQIRGLRGSTVTLGIQRAGEKLDVKVIRERFETSVVNPLSVADRHDDYWADREAGIGYVHIPAFTRHTASQLRKVLVALRNRDLNGLVLDLRDCGGGLMSAATEVVDMFIDEGTIVSSEGRGEHDNTTLRAKPGGEYLDLPLAVLMNRNTASAAEIVAAALQDHHRAATIGERTYGRGTVQAIFRLKDGGALKLTTAAWLRPNGRTLVRREDRDDWGVQPDEGLAVAVSEEDHQQLARQRESRLNGEEVATPIVDAPLNKALAVLRPS